MYHIKCATASCLCLHFAGILSCAGLIRRRRSGACPWRLFEHRLQLEEARRPRQVERRREQTLLRRAAALAAELPVAATDRPDWSEHGCLAQDELARAERCHPSDCPGMIETAAVQSRQTQACWEGRSQTRPRRFAEAEEASRVLSPNRPPVKIRLSAYVQMRGYRAALTFLLTHFLSSLS